MKYAPVLLIVFLLLAERLGRGVIGRRTLMSIVRQLSDNPKVR